MRKTILALSVAALLPVSPVAGARLAPAISSPANVPALISMSALSASLTSHSTTARVNEALEALAPMVRNTSHPDGLRMAFKAYFEYKAANPERVRKPYLYFVDYGLDNRTARGYVFDMDQLTLVEGPFIVAHGRGSSNGKDGVPVRFSNRPGSASTSLGLYVTQETYAFTGHSGGGVYSSIGLRLNGVSGQFNSTARDRGVVVHGAPYVTPSGSGRSEGCPAMEQSRASRLIPKIANGALVFLFSPNDDNWMRRDPWAAGSATAP